MRRGFGGQAALAGYFAALALLTTARADAGELQAAFGSGGAATDWSGDANVYGSLKIGYRGWDLVSAYFLTRIGYATIDERLVTYLSVGAQIWGRLGPVRPYLRIGLAHQHEESAAALRQNPWGAIFGVGDGIRHRAGVEVAAGLDVPIRKWQKWELFATAEGFSSRFWNSVGPAWFWGGGLALGFHYSL